ncbi:MAG: hypothetical protein JWP44_2777 [Mucilaginibacter sp.]|nr:hypothetical protein [Mucilaginibacter sp.]
MKSSVNDALKKLSGNAGALFFKVLEHGSMLVEIYRPVDKDEQTPHLQDELYVVICGTGEFLNAGARSPFQAGDIFFVPAGIEHRFENFGNDFATWVIFYGPKGGEVLSSKS